MEYYSALRKNNAICSNMDGPRNYHTKWNKSERERQIPYDITYMWNLKYDTNELIYETKRDSHIENKVMVTKGERDQRDKVGVPGISRYKLLYIKQINNKLLLYSTGNYIQCPLINHNGKEYEKEYVYIYIYNWITAVYQKLIQHC